MAEDEKQEAKAWKPFGANGPGGRALVVLAAVLAALGLVTALVVMVLWFFVDNTFGSSNLFKTIQALNVLIQPLMLASVVAVLAALVLRERA